MATISITISDSQITVLKNALADIAPRTDTGVEITSSDIDDAYIKQSIIDFLRIRVKSYDEKANRTVNYSTFSPS